MVLYDFNCKPCHLTIMKRKNKGLENLNRLMHEPLIVKVLLPKQEDGDYSLVTKLKVKNGEVSALWGTTLWEGEVF